MAEFTQLWSTEDSVELCRMFGIEPRMVRSLTLKIDGNHALLTVEKYVDSQVMGELKTVIGRYRLVRE
jgi:hypothetical protein